ncbi:hypothetical protein [Novosphingobium resinovorum]|uniref:hypothetical protein n=1 Tax=Novosphingobium resinovorum TaxID=158500 RepID=UPI002ED346A0|nr:hypothetical protein [Novosphingobium resinovorum]
MNKTSITILAALALGAFAPSMASAQQAAHPTAQKTTVKKAAVVKKTTVVKKTPAKKVTCRYQVQHGKKVKVCK